MRVPLTALIRTPSFRAASTSAGAFWTSASRMFVCGACQAKGTRAASLLALSWSSASRCRWWSSAYIPAAARLHLRRRPDAPAAAVVRVLDRDRPLARIVVGLAGAEHGPHRLRREDPARTVDDQALRAPERRDGAALVIDDMAAPVADDLFAHARERAEGDLVRHRPGGHPHGRFLAQQRRDAVLQRIDGGVLAVHVVAHFGGRDGLAHPGGRAGDGIAAQIDEVHWMLRAVRCARRGRSPRLRARA